MNWTPLRLSTPIRSPVFGGTRLKDLFGRSDGDTGRVGESWEVADVDEMQSTIRNGPLRGTTLGEAVAEHGEDIVGPEFDGPRFPFLAKFIDATRELPVHLHADDAAARRDYGAPNGKTEAWFVPWAQPGATVLAGLKPEGPRGDALRQALRDEAFDHVMRRLPVSAGDTIFIPAGTLHSFGPDVIVFEIQQSSDVLESATSWRMSDRAPYGTEEREANLDRLMGQLDPDPQPNFRPGLLLGDEGGVLRRILVASDHFALERLTVSSTVTLTYHREKAVLLSNFGPRVTVIGPDGDSMALDPARSLLLPAALGPVSVEGPADLFAGYVPDLQADVIDRIEARGLDPRVLPGLACERLA